MFIAPVDLQAAEGHCFPRPWWKRLSQSTDDWPADNTQQFFHISYNSQQDELTWTSSSYSPATADQTETVLFVSVLNEYCLYCFYVFDFSLIPFVIFISLLLYKYILYRFCVWLLLLVVVSVFPVCLMSANQISFGTIIKFKFKTGYTLCYTYQQIINNRHLTIDKVAQNKRFSENR